MHAILALHDISVTNGVVRVVGAIIIVLNGIVEIIRHARYMVLVEMLVTKDLASAICWRWPWGSLRYRWWRSISWCW